MGLFGGRQAPGGLFGGREQTWEHRAKSLIPGSQFNTADTPYGGGEAQEGKGGFLGSGMGGEDITNVLMRAMAIANGDYGGASSIGQNIGRRKRESDQRAAEREEKYADFVREQEYRAANEPPEQAPMERDLKVFMNLPDDQKAAYAEMMKMRAPYGGFFTGKDGQRYQDTPDDGGDWVDEAPGGAAPTATRPLSPAGGSGFVPPPRLTGGAMTSGRRTPEGNRLVGGVADSAHLNGTAADYDGPDLPALLAEARRLPGVSKAMIHNGHVHTEGKGWNTPYFGKRGTTGLRKR